MEFDSLRVFLIVLGFILFFVALIVLVSPKTPGLVQDIEGMKPWLVYLMGGVGVLVIIGAMFLDRSL